MYKKQMTFQRIVCFLAVIGGALTFIYALALATDLYDGLFYYTKKVAGAELFYNIQPFNTTLTYVSIGMILLSVLLFLTQTHVRRRYYIGNFVSTGLYCAGAVATTVWTWKEILGAGGYKELFLTTVDFTKLAQRAAAMKKEYIDSTFFFDVQLVLGIILVAVSVLLIINLIWKLSLMRAEASLIAEK